MEPRHSAMAKDDAALFGALFSAQERDEINAASLSQTIIRVSANDASNHVQDIPCDASAHFVVHADAASTGTVFLRLRPSKDMHCVIEAFVEDDAKLSVITLTERNPHVVSIRARSRVGASAAVHWHATTLGNDVTHDLRSRIVGDHGTSNVDWIFHALDRDKHRVSVTNAFEGRDGGGEITMKGVAQDRASVRCYGLIDIGLHGGGTDTYLTENVLMLDATSIIDAIPALEIKTNDVKASHSATVSRVTEEDLFYFAARGIQQQEARKMYIEGFLNALIERVESSRIADALQASLCFSK